MIQYKDNKLYDACKELIAKLEVLEYSEALEFLSEIETLDIIENVSVNKNRVEIISNGSIGNIIIESNEQFKSIKIAIVVFIQKYISFVESYIFAYN